ncbi:MAG: hypothetical protein ACRDJM_11615 [Actinomycetota bacterium]
MSNLYPGGNLLGPRLTPAAARLAAIVTGTLLLGLFAIPIKLGSGPAFGVAGRIAGAVGAPFGYRSADVSIHSAEFDTTKPLVFDGADGQQITPARIRRFLVRRDSPMARYAEEIVVAGLRYRVDPRVVVAIAGVESTYGLYSRGHNAWGWNAGRARWSSWRTAIDGFTRALGREYRSLRTGRFAAASRTYCPPCGRGWGVQALRIFRSI